MFFSKVTLFIVALLLPGVSISRTIAREAVGWGTDRNSAIEYALKGAKSQIAGIETVLHSYQIHSEKPPQEYYWVALKDVVFSNKSIPYAEGWGIDRKQAINDALLVATAMACGVDVTGIQILRKTEIDCTLFEFFDQKVESRISGIVIGFTVSDENPSQKAYMVRLRAQFRTFDVWRTVCYSTIPGGGLIYKKRNWMEVFAKVQIK